MVDATFKRVFTPFVVSCLSRDSPKSSSLVGNMKKGEVRRRMVSGRSSPFLRVTQTPKSEPRIS
jgi:hypothetical protein